jgi:hypothetical protein
MKENYRSLYRGLLKDLHAIGELSVAEQERTESCFKCCLEYWVRVKAIADANASRMTGRK